MGRIPRLAKEKKLNSPVLSSLSNDSDDTNTSSYNQSDNSQSSLKLKDMIMMSEKNSSHTSFSTYNSFVPVNNNKCEHNLNLNISSSDSIYFKMSFENSNQLFLNSLRDKTFNLFKMYSSRYDSMYERAVYYTSQNIQYVDGRDDVKLSEIWSAVMYTISNDLEPMAKYLNSLPGFSFLKRNDFSNLFKENLFTIYILTTIRLYINGELYYCLNGNIQYTRKRMGQAFGFQATDKMFECALRLQEIKITESELALLIPYIITQTSK